MTEKTATRLALLSISALVLWMFWASYRPAAAVGAQTTIQTARLEGRTLNTAEISSLLAEMSNWNRWGPGDQLGAVNLITPAKRVQAAGLVKTGTSVSLAHDVITSKAVDVPNPFEQRVTVGSSSVGERQSISYHGLAFSHIDALCHGFHSGRSYNGYSVADVVSVEKGCSKLGIGVLKDGIVTRGVLLDIPRLKGLPYLEPGTRVLNEDIDAWEKKAGVRASAGDALLLRTGRWPRRALMGPFTDLAGFDISILSFLKNRDVALLGSDGIQDVGYPEAQAAIHRIALVGLGVPLFDNLDLEKLAETAAKLNRWEFMLVVAPLAVENGVGSPINAIAIF